jgi:hypothetical protein
MLYKYVMLVEAHFTCVGIWTVPHGMVLFTSLSEEELGKRQSQERVSYNGMVLV